MITLQEIAPYLPYGVKCLTPICHGKGNYGPLLLSGLIKNYSRFYVGEDFCNCEFDQIKLILRPLSDLTIEIEHSGKEFVPIVEICNMIGLHIEPSQLEVKGTFIKVHLLNEPYVLIDTSNFNLKIEQFQKLFEWHFWLGDQNRFGQDIIDINTLK